MHKALIFIGGLIGGAIVGYKLAEKDAEIRYKAAVESIRKAHDDDIKEMRKRMDQAEAKTAEAESDRDLFAKTLTRLGYTGQPQEPPKRPDPEPMTDEPYFSREESSDPSVLEIPTEAEFQRMEEEWNRPPEVISQSEYDHDHEIGYDQKSVLWYPEDGILLDGDNNELMDDPDSFLGTAWREDIDHSSIYSIAGESYVRNYRWETDYFILKRPGLGLDEMSIL